MQPLACVASVQVATPVQNITGYGRPNGSSSEIAGPLTRSQSIQRPGGSARPASLVLDDASEGSGRMSATLDGSGQAVRRGSERFSQVEGEPVRADEEVGNASSADERARRHTEPVRPATHS